jgi:hypothetical protein
MCYQKNCLKIFVLQNYYIFCVNENFYLILRKNYLTACNSQITRQMVDY